MHATMAGGCANSEASGAGRAGTAHSVFVFEGLQDASFAIWVGAQLYVYVYDEFNESLKAHGLRRVRFHR